jgi:predicted ester cyclase
MRQIFPDGIMHGVVPLDKRELPRRSKLLCRQRRTTRPWCAALSKNSITGGHGRCRRTVGSRLRIRDALTGKEASIEGYTREKAEQAATSCDLHFSIEEQFAEGDKVVTRYIGSGTHDLAEYEGLAQTGVRITIEKIDIDRVVEGKIVDERSLSDTSPLWQRRMEQERIERERIEQELLVARRIQQALLPR